MSQEILRVLQPEGWAPAKGYANGIAAHGEMIFVAGMIGWNGHCQFETDDFVAQCKQALQNIVATLACAVSTVVGVGGVLFLASDAAANITGTRLVVDGGCSAQHMPRDIDV